jgi:hypothetical protein
MSGVVSDGRTGMTLQYLLALASTVVLRSESHGTRDHILLSQVRDIPYRCLLRLAGLMQWYSTPPLSLRAYSLSRKLA